METSHTTGEYDTYNFLFEIKLILSSTASTKGKGRETTAFCVTGNQLKQRKRQMHQKCVPECMSLFPT